MKEEKVNITKKFQIHYFVINLKELSQISFMDNGESLISKIDRFNSDHKDDEMIFKSADNTYIVEILDLESKNSTMFGSVGRLTDFKNKPFTRQRSGPNLEEQSLENISDYIEQYTYFLFNYKDLKCNIIYRKSVGSFKSIFSEFLRQHFKLNGIYESVDVLSLKSTNIKERLTHASDIDNIRFKYSSNDNTLDNYLPPRKIASLSNSVRTADVKLKLRTDIKKDKKSEILTELSNTDYSEFDDFIVDTKHEIIDMVEKVIIEKKEIELNLENLKDDRIIKSTLIENFNPN